MDKRFSFGIVRSEQTRLRGFGGTAGAVGFGPFAGDSVAVQRRVGEQIKSLWRETKLMLRDGKRRLLRFMVGAPLRLIRRVEGGILVAGVNPSAGAELAARVLPNLPSPVPMEAKLRQLRRHVARLLVIETESKPTCRQPGTIPKSAEFHGRASQ